MTTKELAQITGLTEYTIHNYARRGIIPGRNYRGKKGWVFNLEKVERALTLKFGNAAEKEAMRRAAK